MANYVTKAAVLFHVFLMGAYCSLQRCLPMPYLNLFDRVNVSWQVGNPINVHADVQWVQPELT